MSAAPPPLTRGEELRVRYTNWRGVTAERHLRVLRVYHGATRYHPEPQWLVEGLDLDKGEERTFAWADMTLLP